MRSLWTGWWMTALTPCTKTSAGLSLPFIPGRLDLPFNFFLPFIIEKSPSYLSTHSIHHPFHLHALCFLSMNCQLSLQRNQEDMSSLPCSDLSPSPSRSGARILDKQTHHFRRATNHTTQEERNFCKELSSPPVYTPQL